MTNPLHAAYYADQAVHESVRIVENVPIADRTYRCRVHCPEMARRFFPGQFLMVRTSDGDDPLIGRPFALYDVVSDPQGRPAEIDFVYLVEGKLTGCLAKMQAGQSLTIWGPLGNGFQPKPCRHLIMVAGGIGQTPFLAVARERIGAGFPSTGTARMHASVETATLCYGAATADRLAGLDQFAAEGVAVFTATEDGSHGHAGRVTDVLRARLDEHVASHTPREDLHVLCCGPHPMMAAVFAMTDAYGVECEVSLEEPMACGIGICFACVARIRDASNQWDYKRTCVSGPVFDARAVAWSESP